MVRHCHALVSYPATITSETRHASHRSFVHGWLADVLSADACSAPTDISPHSDKTLTQYQREAARDAQDALNPHINMLNPSGLLVGNGIDWSRWSSNNWAMRVCGISLLDH